MPNKAATALGLVNPYLPQAALIAAIPACAELALMSLEKSAEHVPGTISG